MTIGRCIALLLFVGVAATVAALGSGLLSLAALQAQLAMLLAWRTAHPLAAALIFTTCYIASAALSLPVNVVLALAGGALFGTGLGTALVLVSAATGSTLAMLSSRWLLRDLVRRRFAARLEEVERGLAREGWLYLLSVRLMPVVPYTVVNLLFGLTRFPPGRFLAASLLGMAPATLLYVQAGTGLGHLTSLGDVLSARILGSLALLATLPLATGFAFRRWRQHQKN